MKVENFLAQSDLAIDVVATDKVGLLKDLSVRSGARLGMKPERILSELLKREQLGSTGTGGGVAIPHARLHDVQRPFAVLVRVKEPIDFAAVDGDPVDIIVLLLLPDGPGGAALSALACIARKLRDPITMTRLRRARDNAELYRALTQDAL
jgi:nitrogen PTS system EIIA component